jgi:prefoldin subunit 5
MNQEKLLKEKIALVEKEVATISELADELSAALKDVEDLKLELKGLKVFLGRMHPEFKSQFPEILRKVRR